MGRRLEYEVKTSVRLNMSNPQHVKINDVIQNLDPKIFKSKNQFIIDAIQFYIDNYGKETFVIKKKEKERAEYIRSEDIDDIKEEVIEAATNEARKEVIRLLGGVISGMNVGQPVIMQAANSEAQEPTEDVMDDVDVAGLAMLLNEIINEVGMTKRAVKYYEEKGLLSVDKDNNGYRNYTAQDVETLKKISVYRKLGISIKDIQSLLETGDKSILLRIYQEKVQEKVLKDSELEALKQFIDDGDADKANEALDYQTVENAIESLLPGKEWGDYFKSHFKPFLNVRLKTLEQKQALQNILEYCDETTLKVPFIMGIGAKMIGWIAQETRTADEMIAYYRDMSESEYERLKEKVWKGAKIKNGIMKYHPAFIAQRKMQKELQNKGYNDIFIPNLMVLSPTYAEYKKALDNVNDRMCRELGLYYDSNYNLVIKKDNSK